MCRQSQHSNVVRAATHTHTRTQYTYKYTLWHTLTHARTYIIRRKMFQTHNTYWITKQLKKEKKKDEAKEKRKKKQKKPVCLNCVVSMWLWFRPFTVWYRRRALSHSCTMRHRHVACVVISVYCTVHGIWVEAEHMHRNKNVTWRRNSIYTVNQIDLNAQHTTYIPRITVFKHKKWLTQHVRTGTHLLLTKYSGILS